MESLSKMKLFTTSILILLLTTTSVIGAELYCPKTKSSGEGSIPIPEKAFTKKNVDREIIDLEEAKELVKKDPAAYQEVLDMQKENSATIIKGYKLKQQIIMAVKSKTNVKDSIEKFCRFLREEAYVYH